jgi:hypothetical protein
MRLLADDAAALIGAAHFEISLSTNFCRYSGERRSGATIVAPTSFSLAYTAGVFMASTAVALSLCTIAVGVPRGRNNANQM